jgi:hypothetical protein
MTEAISAPAETESGAAGVTPLSPIASGEAQYPPPRAAAPVKTVEDARKVLAEMRLAEVEQEVVSKPARKGRKEKVPKGDGKCTAYAPLGTKCKLCGKVHPV